MQGKKRILTTTLTVFFCAFVSLAAFATDYYWNAADDDWSVGSNWTPSGPPTPADNAYIENGGTSLMSTDTELLNLFAGYNNSGTINQTDGTNTISTYNCGLYLGYNSGSSGTYNLLGGVLSTWNEYIGYDGTGVFNHTDGTNTVAYNLFLGVNTGSNGIYNMSANVSASFVSIGSYGTGTFNQIDGTHTIKYYLYLGCNPGSNGTYNLSADTLSIGKKAYIGYYGAGVFNQTGGVVRITTGQDYGLYIAYNPGSSGTYNMSAGDLVVNKEYIGVFGTGVFNQTGGTHAINSFFYIGAASYGTYNLSAGSLTVGSSEYVGYPFSYFYGEGEFNQTGGTHEIGWRLILGCYSDYKGTYNLSAGSLIIDGYLTAGKNGTGVFNQTGGTFTTDEIRIGEEEGSWGEYTFTGGSLEIGCFCVEGDLSIENGWMDIDLNKIDYFRVMGNKVDLLDGYILDGKIFDRSLCPEGWLYAVYDSENDWTTLQSVPEPGTIAMLAAGALGLAGVIRKKMF